MRVTAKAIARAFTILDRSGLFAPPSGELSIALLDAREMSDLHARFFDDPTPTDVITFEGDPQLQQAGEICVCVDVAREYASEQGQEFSDELTLYLVHGYLHLSGYDDTTPTACARMRRAERAAMATLKKADALPAFRGL